MRPAGLIVASAIAGLLALGTGTALAAVPIFTLDPTPTVGYTTAHVSGTLDPADNEVFPFFRYGHDPEAEGEWTGLGPLYFTMVPISGAGPHTVEDDLSELKPGTEYKFRLGAQTIPGEEFFESDPPFPSFTTKAAATPTAMIDPITTHTDSTAHFAGTVETNAPAGPLDPEGEAVFKADWSFSCEPACPNLSPDAGAGSVDANETSKGVVTDAAELEPNKTYAVTLTATNLAGSASDTKSFTTTEIPPTVIAASGAADGQSGYTLQGVVNPKNSDLSDCEFEYGLTAAYGQSAPCATIPGAVNRPVEVMAHLSGLTPGIPYHFKVKAANDAGTVESGDATFVPTQGEPVACPNEQLRVETGSLALPECRAYEMVSPPNKEGGEAKIFGFSSDGDSVGYTSLTGTNIANSGQGSIYQNMYVANRTDAGWETISNLNGPTGSLFSGPEALSGIAGPTVYAADLQSSLWFVDPGSRFGGLNHTYIRNPDGSFTLVGNQLPGRNLTSAFSDLLLRGASADLSHLLLDGDLHQSSLDLVFGPGVYEFVGTGNDQPRRVDLDSSSDVISHCPRQDAADPANAHGDMMSSDGRVAIFTALGGCGGTNPKANEVWARVDGTSSYDASLSRCTRTAADPGGVCNAPANAHFIGGSKDGFRIYFTTTQQLVNGDTDEANDLYLYELPTASNPAPTLTEVSGGEGEANVEELVYPAIPIESRALEGAVSDDGSTVYFSASGVLASNSDALGEEAVAGNHNLYVWRRDADHPNGETKFIGRLLADDLRLSLLQNGQPPQATPDGRYLVFTTASPLVATDTDTSRDVYRYDTDSGTLVRVSINVAGVGGNADGADASIASTDSNRALGYDSPSQLPGPHPHGAITSDGKTIVFETSEALSPLDLNGGPDVYLWKAGSVSLLSAGSTPPTADGALTPIVDSSGRDVFFRTTQRLAASDGDSQIDVYDARIGGGFSSARLRPPCSGEACQPPGGSPPVGPIPSTDRAPVAEGKPKQCPRGKVLKRKGCVKKKHKKHHRKKNSHRASHSGGGSK